MATQLNPATAAIKRSTVILAENSDFEVYVYSPADQRGQRYATQFKVDKDSLINGSDYFAASVRFNTQNNHQSTVLKDESIEALHVCLAYLHAGTEQDEEEVWRRDVIHTADITVIWHIISACDKYLFDCEALKGYFEKWYQKNVVLTHLTLRVARQLALPCSFFDHAQGFAEITKWLAYNCNGHISELKPIAFKWSHLHLCPPDFVGPMNHARGSLKTNLHRGLWDKVGRILRRKELACTCGQWAQIAGYYFAGLTATDAYPLEMTFSKKSFEDLLDMLEDFKMRKTLRPACESCNVNWEVEVRSACSNTARYFDGLCLDCMDSSKFKRKDQHEDYWEHLGSVNGRWDTKCRIRHGQPTWYMSWCGRAEHREKLIRRHREHRRH